MKGNASHTQMRVLLSFGIFVAVSVISLLPAWRIVLSAWTNLGSYEHGLLAAALVCILIYRDSRSSSDPPGPVLRWSAISAIALATLVFAFSAVLFANMGIAVLAVAALPPILTLGLYVNLGTNRRRLMISALPFLLYCALPVWDQFAEVLRQITVEIVSVGLSISGVTALIDGNTVFLRLGTFEIAQGCSGLRFFLTAIAMSGFYCAFERIGVARSIVIVFVAALAAMILNWLRVLIIILSGEFLGMDSWIVQSHYFFGWVLFVTFLSLTWFLLGRRIARPVSGAGEFNRSHQS